MALARSFDLEPNVLEADISESAAIHIAHDYVSDLCEVTTCELTYVDPQHYNLENSNYQEGYCYLAYKIRFDEGMVEVIVNAMDGCVIGFDQLLSEEARCYTIEESSDSSDYGYRGDVTQEVIDSYNEYRLDNIELAEEAYDSLGYDVTLSQAYSTSAINTSMEDYVAGTGSEYALYFCGHASTTLLGFKHHTIISSSDVSGNWHFVFLDGCSTAANTGWATAFNIYGSSNCAFLGWSAPVYLSNTHAFNEEFWPLLNGTTTVRKAAVDAARAVPGSGTTPIRFYGDTTYNGEAGS